VSGDRWQTPRSVGPLALRGLGDQLGDNQPAHVDTRLDVRGHRMPSEQHVCPSSNGDDFRS
jgi:hypothetical protein